MKFKAYQLVIDETNPEQQDIQILLQDTTIHFDYNDYHYASFKTLESGRFLWVSSDFDNVELYAEKVYNNAAKSEQKNPRTKYQFELRQQLFFCYDIKDRRFYISDHTKKGFIKKYFSDILGKPVFIKPIVASLKEYEATIHALTTVTFTQVNNLYNQDKSGLFQKQISALGLDIPESMKVRLNYGFLPLDQARKVLQELNRAFKKAQFQDLVAIGIDDSGVEYAFDFDRVYASIEVNAEKDGNGHYDPNEIKEKFIKEIQRIENLRRA